MKIKLRMEEYAMIKHLLHSLKHFVSFLCLAFISVGLLMFPTQTMAQRERRVQIFFVRKIVKIDEEKCNGCGACVAVCSQRAIALMREKAVINHRLCRECGNCLEVCVASAIYEEVKEPQFIRIKRQAQASAQALV